LPTVIRATAPSSLPQPDSCVRHGPAADPTRRCALGVRPAALVDLDRETSSWDQAVRRSALAFDRSSGSSFFSCSRLPAQGPGHPPQSCLPCPIRGITIRCGARTGGRDPTTSRVAAAACPMRVRSVRVPARDTCR
jgi:hypothetical protein